MGTDERTDQGSSGRAYLQSHPWISFRADLCECSYRVWLLLGQAQSTCSHVAGVPLRPAMAEELYKVFLTKGAAATTAIEGNTLSEEEVRRRIDGDLALPKSREYLGVEVDNVLAAYKLMGHEVRAGQAPPLTAERIRMFNKLALMGLEVSEDVVPGQCRRHSVGVGSYRGAPWQDCDFLLDQLCEWLNGPDFEPASEDLRFSLAAFRAVLAHLYLAWIHPFGDGNGRTARLVEVQLLVQSGLVPLPCAFILSNHYNKTRERYYRELERSSKDGGQTIAFVEYALEGFVDGLREQLEWIRGQQLEVTWENYVHQCFSGEQTRAGVRRKRLLLDMPPGVVPRHRVRYVSPLVSEAYAALGDKTVARDLDALESMGLIVRVGKGEVAANRASILAFLAPVVG